MKKVCQIERVILWMVAVGFAALMIIHGRRGAEFRLASSGSVADGLFRLLRRRGMGDARERGLVPACLVAIDPSLSSGSPRRLPRSRRR